jgi:hypothetical protein
VEGCDIRGVGMSGYNKGQLGVLYSLISRKIKCNTIDCSVGLIELNRQVFSGFKNFIVTGLVCERVSKKFGLSPDPTGGGLFLSTIY